MSVLKLANWLCWVACLQLVIVAVLQHCALADDLMPELEGGQGEAAGLKGVRLADRLRRSSARSRRFGAQPSTEMFKNRMEARKSGHVGTRGLIRRRRHENIGGENPVVAQPDTGMRRLLRDEEEFSREDMKAAFSNMPAFSKASRASGGAGEMNVRSRIQRSPTLSRIAAMGGSTKGSVRLDATVRGRGSDGRGAVNAKRGGGVRLHPATRQYMNEKKPSVKEAVARARRIAKQNPELKVDYGDGIDPVHAPKDYIEMPAIMSARRAQTIQERGGPDAPVPHPPPEPKPEKAGKKSPPPELKIKT